MKYTKEILEAIMREGGGTVLGEYAKYNQRMTVKFKCECGLEATKRFEMLNLYRLPYCESCSKKYMVEKIKKTCIKKFGVDNAGRLPEIIEKIKNTFQEKFGCHPKQTEDVQEKWKATCLDKYGGHPNQNKEVQVKSENKSFAFKDYMMPSGNVIKYQGYENLALDELVQIYEEEDIAVGRSNVPTVDYYIGDEKHVYFPDFFIKSENKIIEVKSQWTLQLRRANIEEKALATIQAGYKYEIWIYSDKKVKVETKVY